MIESKKICILGRCRLLNSNNSCAFSIKKIHFNIFKFIEHNISNGNVVHKSKWKLSNYTHSQESSANFLNCNSAIKYDIYNYHLARHQSFKEESS